MAVKFKVVRLNNARFKLYYKRCWFSKWSSLGSFISIYDILDLIEKDARKVEVHW